MSELLETRIRNKKAKIGIIGLGYVGLPLAVAFAGAGYKVTGFDTDKEKISSINNGLSYIPDVKKSEIKDVVRRKLLRATLKTELLKKQDAVHICVPTPLRKSKEPDISFIIDAARKIKRHLHKNELIILESTTYPGTTEEVLLPLFLENKLKVGEDFYLAFSPERVDPGNAKYTTQNIPKVIGGITEKCTALAAILYRQIVKKVVPVSSPKTAETVKLLENTFRSANIALANELALICSKLGINVWEVVDAAATKPFGFMPFYPGPGLGGHCIPVDPYYLSWKARLNGFEAKFIDLAGEINRSMPDYVVERIADALNSRKTAVSGSSIFILGVAYKKDIGDCRESPAIEIIKKLLAKGAKVSYNDPFIPEIAINRKKLRSAKLSSLSNADCAVIVTSHSQYNISDIVASSSLVVDTRNATGRLGKKYKEKIFGF